MKIVQEVTQEAGIYLANSMNSLRIEGQKTVSIEICEQLGWSVPDWIVIPGGNLGNVSALAKGLDDLLALGLIAKKPRIAVAQATHANPFYQAYLNGFVNFAPVQAQKTLASAIQIGNPVSYPKAKKAILDYNGVVEEATEQELADASAWADKVGLYTCPHTGVALAALKNLCQKGTIQKGETVAVVSTAHGLKFTEFKAGYHEGTLAGIEPRYANQIHQVANSVGAVMDVLKNG
jgi:threonine synthase